MIRKLFATVRSCVQALQLEGTPTVRGLQASPAPAHQSTPLTIEAWHGGGVRFQRFSTNFVGTGEGASALGWGLYFSEDRRIAEYNASRRNFEGKGPGYLYRVKLTLVRERVLHLDCPDTPDERRLVDQYLNLSAHERSRTIADSFRRRGVDAIRGYEQERASTGDTIVCFSDAGIEVIEVFTLTDGAFVRDDG